MVFNRIMINGEIIFDVNANELYSLADNRVIVSLNAPTARCLRFLLESKGKIISRDEFLSEVWNARGVVVSQNTFYQNISLLRKSLEKAGLTKNIIITVRHRGFVLAPDTDVKVCPNTDVAQSSHFLNEDLNGSIIENDIGNKSESSLINQNVKPQKQGMLNISRWVLLLLIVMMGANIILLFFNLVF